MMMFDMELPLAATFYIIGKHIREKWTRKHENYINKGELLDNHKKRKCPINRKVMILYSHINTLLCTIL